MEILQLCHVPTESYRRRPVTEETRVKIIIIPGNPGVVDFYTLFVDTLFSNLEGKHEVVAVAHAGHTGTPVENKIFSVEDQIQHKIDVLEHLRKESVHKTNTNFVLIGHSVGAYICLKVLKRRPDLGVINVVNLFPTIKHLWQGLAPAVKVLILPGVRNAMSTLVHYLPTKVTSSIVSYVATLSDEARYVMSNKVNYHLIMNVLYMAYREGQEILDIDEECNDVLTNHAPNMYFLYSPTDQYTPRHFYDEMLALYPKGNFEMAEVGVKHAFVLKNSVTVANKVSSFLVSQLAARGTQS